MLNGQSLIIGFFWHFYLRNLIYFPFNFKSINSSNQRICMQFWISIQYTVIFWSVLYCTVLSCVHLKTFFKRDIETFLLSSELSATTGNRSLSASGPSPAGAACTGCWKNWPLPSSWPRPLGRTPADRVWTPGRPVNRKGLVIFNFLSHSLSLYLIWVSCSWQTFCVVNFCNSFCMCICSHW